MNSGTQIMPAPLTYEDYCLIPEDGQRHEIINGVQHVSPAPGYKHQRLIVKFGSLLDKHVEHNQLGTILIAPFDVLLSETQVVQPDILFVSSAHLSIITNKNAQGVPDLVVEILSESNRRYDEVVKRKLYEQFDVSEYWIVDPELETVKVYQLQDKGYGVPALLSRERKDVLESALLPGFQLTLESVFNT